MLLKKKRTNHMLVSGCFVILVALTSCSPGSLEPTYQQADTLQQNEAYPAPAPFEQSIQDDIEQYESLLNQEVLNDEDRLRVESLLAEAQEVATMVAAPPSSGGQIAADIAEHESQIAEERIEPTPTPELGILESGIFFEVHVPRRVQIENIWQGYVDGNLTRIYAGRLLPDYRLSTSIEKEEAQFGALYVMTFLPDGKVETDLHGTEKETGALRIQDVTEEFLMLRSTGTKELSSQVYYYGLQAERLVASPDELNGLPTATPNLDSYP
jgi:hypothetical protein